MLSDTVSDPGEHNCESAPSNVVQGCAAVYIALYNRQYSSALDVRLISMLKTERVVGLCNVTLQRPSCAGNNVAAERRI